MKNICPDCTEMNFIAYLTWFLMEFNVCACPTAQLVCQCACVYIYKCALEDHTVLLSVSPSTHTVGS